MPLCATVRRVLLVIAVVVTWSVVSLWPVPAHAQTRAPGSLAQLSIEELMNIPVTSVARKEQRTADVAAAVFVITREDIRRSGLRTLPDLLRLAPGVQVADINSNRWAVSVRGFNAMRANKLLVLVDGRSVYNRLFSGVLWDEQNLMLDDIDRIEVIRGPGAALWGANAVNGVINIVTRSAVESQGFLLRADGGNQGAQLSTRYGGVHGAMSYRVFAQATGRFDSLLTSGQDANDESQSQRIGFRADWGNASRGLMLDAAYAGGKAHSLWTNLDPASAAREPIDRTRSTRQGGHLLARWVRDQTAGGAWQVQTFVDVSSRKEPTGDLDRRIFDLDTQYRATISGRHDLVVGGGYRFVSEGLKASVGISLTPETSHLTLWTAFVQDESSWFDDRLSVALGTQVQHDSNAGSGIQPTARLLWKGWEHQRVWAAVSRGLRTPSLQERGIRVTLPPTPSPAGPPLIRMAVGNPDARTEEFVDGELGYRLEIGSVASLDVTGFVGRYDHLQTQEVSAPIVQFTPTPRIVVTQRFANLLRADTRGLEVSGRWMPTPDLRLEGSVTAFRLTPEFILPGPVVASALEDGNAPERQWRLSATYTPFRRATVYAAVAHTGRLRLLNIDAYTRTDVTADVQLSSRVSALIVGQNLFDRAHPEFAGQNLLLQATQTPRSVSVSLRWTSR